MTNQPDLPALIGSRICHDLISPIGAIGNGVELLSMTGSVGGTEMVLIAESAASANARIRFFRIAFGASAGARAVAPGEIRALLDDLGRGGRIRVDWAPPGEVPRPEAKLVFLAILCLETALPLGGRISVGTGGAGWSLAAEGPRLKADPRLWAALGAGPLAPDLSPAEVQFALLPAEAERQGRALRATTGTDRITIRF